MRLLLILAALSVTILSIYPRDCLISVLILQHLGGIFYILKHSYFCAKLLFAARWFIMISSYSLRALN